MDIDEKITKLFGLLYYTGGLSEAVKDSYKMDGPNKIICSISKCNHISSFQDKNEPMDDLEELAKEHAMFVHGEELLKKHLKPSETLLESEAPIVKQFLSGDVTLEQFAEQMLENSKILTE